MYFKILDGKIKRLKICSHEILLSFSNQWLNNRICMAKLLQESFKYIEDIQIFGMNMPFISSSEAKNTYFMSGEATNEIYIFSLHEMK